MSSAWVYIMSNRRDGTLYIGVTSDLAARVMQHKTGKGGGFTAKHGLNVLVHAEQHESIVAAIRREKTMKTWLRAWKVRLINQHNPEWRDLHQSIMG